MKPPIGLKPRQFWEEERMIELLEAMLRYLHAGLAIPDKWLEELRELNEKKLELTRFT